MEQCGSGHRTWRQEEMKDAMRQDSYETILRAVGRILDQAEAQRFSVTSSESGLVVEAFDATGQRSLGDTLSIGELVQLVDWVHATSATPQYAHAGVADEGILEQFLRERQGAPEESREGELVGAR
jgi:hypothetical protein